MWQVMLSICLSTIFYFLCKWDPDVIWSLPTSQSSSLTSKLSVSGYLKEKIIILEDNKTGCPFRRNGNFETGFTMMWVFEVKATSICYACCYLLCLIIQLLDSDTIYSHLCFPTLGFWIIRKAGKKKMQWNAWHSHIWGSGPVSLFSKRRKKQKKGLIFSSLIK